MKIYIYMDYTCILKEQNNLIYLLVDEISHQINCNEMDLKKT